jgi:PBSX family phage terminase large subunit
LYKGVDAKLAINKLVPFNQKYIDYYNRTQTHVEDGKTVKGCRVNVLEGAFRAGKTVVNIFSFASYLYTCEDKLHLVSGATSGTARKNVLDNDGLGLQDIFAGKCRKGKYEGSDALFIKDHYGKEKIVMFVGGGMSDSYKAIQGLSFGSWLSVELANLYISDDEKCFIDMALSRLTQSKDQRIWWDLNPVYPSHKVYKKYLDKYEAQQAEGKFVGGYNYLKCTLFDNSSLSEEQRANFLSNYPDEDSMEYQRYILGNRAAAEGLIFKQFAKNSKPSLVSRVSDVKGFIPSIASIGIDFGGNGSNTTFVFSLIDLSRRKIVVCCSDMLIMKGGQNGVNEYSKALGKFLHTVEAFKKEQGIAIAVKYCFPDSADNVMIVETARTIKALGIKGVCPTVQPCKKHTIQGRIDCKAMALATGRYFFVKGSANTAIESTATLVWNNKAGHEDERLDDGTCDVDTADAEEYSWSAWLQRL